MSEFISQDDLEAVRELLQLVSANNLSEISVTLGDGSAITVVTHSGAAPTPAVYAFAPTPTDLTLQAPQIAANPAPVSQAANTAQFQPSSANRLPVPSPMVGIFYASPSPDEPAFVGQGDRIEVGQTIGLIEAMKVFSEIPSEVAGRVVEIPVTSGDLVQLGQALMYVEGV